MLRARRSATQTCPNASSRGHLSAVSPRWRQEAQAPGLLSETRLPAWMDKCRRQIWREVLADAPFGLLRRIDRQLLVNYVELVARHETAAMAQRKLNKVATPPLLTEGSEHAVISPYVRIMNHCVMLMTRLQNEMGFTPTSRVSLGAAVMSVGEVRRVSTNCLTSSCRRASILIGPWVLRPASPR